MDLTQVLQLRLPLEELVGLLERAPFEDKLVAWQCFDHLSGLSHGLLKCEWISCVHLVVLDCGH